MPLANKLLFLGLDGLDRDLLIQWNLTNLLQREFGALDVPIVERFEMPLTPSVWASFLTGEMIDDLIFTRSGLRGRLLEILVWLRRRIPLSLGLGPRIRRDTVLELPKLDRATMIDRPSVSEINAPFYSYDNLTQKLLRRLETDEVEIDQVANELYAEYTRKTRLLITEIPKRLVTSDVVFAYMHFPDCLEHILYPNPLRVKTFYFDLDLFVAELMDYVPEGVDVLIISDHGFNLDAGRHSNSGFYSSSRALNPKPVAITDFYHMVVEGRSSQALDKRQR
jgi:hypothetical protein